MTTAYNLLKGLPKIEEPKSMFDKYRYDREAVLDYFRKVKKFANYKGYSKLYQTADSACFHIDNGVFVDMFIRQIEHQLAEIYIK